MHPTREIVRVHGIAHGGQGVGRGEGEGADPRTWLIDSALPGELVAAERIHEGKKLLRGITLEVIEAAAERSPPPCAVAAICGGCTWQHVAPAAQLGLKRAIVDGQLRQLGAKVTRAIASPQALHYRRRARVHYRREGDGLALGFHRSRSHLIVDVDACPILEASLCHALRRLRAVASFLPEEGEVHLVGDGARVVIGLPGVRPGDAVDEALRSILDEILVGVVLRGGRERHGVGVSFLELDGSDTRPSMTAGPFVFAQAQQEQNNVLVGVVAAAAKVSGRRVLELYAGAGNFSRVLAGEASRVWALEESRESVAHLRALASDYKLGLEARHGRAEAHLAKLAKAGKTYDVVVLDPPRKGLGRACVDLAKVALERIVYVSCDPATLARDLGHLVEAGWKIGEVTLLDMMPMTSEVEVVVTLAAPRRAG